MLAHKIGVETNRTNDIKCEAEDVSFSKMLLSDELLKGLTASGFITPSPIQLRAIPLGRCKLDLIIQAKSGTGKTLVFGCVLLEIFDPDIKFPQSLIIAPTREIAVQIVNVLNSIGKFIKHFRAESFIGGTDLLSDRKKIQKTSVVVGTPGRINHLIQNEIFNISFLKLVVLDEADKLMEQGNLGKEVADIMKSFDKSQIIATTATVTDHLEKSLNALMKNPIGITPSHEIPVLLGIKQFYAEIPDEQDNIKLLQLKIDQVKRIIAQVPYKQILMFTNMQSRTESYSNYLEKSGFKNDALNGSMDQAKRLEILEKLKKFKCRILITTDLIARGIDIENINVIINLDLPYDCCTYLHRIGRAGRFGSHGIAISLVSGHGELAKFRRMLGDIGGSDLGVLKLPSVDPIPDLWNFENMEDEKNIFGEIKGIGSEISAETVSNNLSLLEVAKLMVNDPVITKPEINFVNLLEDYENFLCHQNPTEVHISDIENSSTLNGNGLKLYEADIPQESIAESPKMNENEFLNAINELKLYENDIQQKETNLTNSPVHKSKIIFRQTQKDSESEDGDFSESESEFESESESESENESEGQTNSISSNVADDSNIGNTESNFHWYNEYCRSQQERWYNIYSYQLASIQNHVKYSKNN